MRAEQTHATAKLNRLPQCSTSNTLLDQTTLDQAHNSGKTTHPHTLWAHLQTILQELVVQNPFKIVSLSNKNVPQGVPGRDNGISEWKLPCVEFTLAPPSPPPFEFPEHLTHMSGGLGFENFRKFAAGQTICCLAWAMVGVCRGRGGKWRWASALPPHPAHPPPPASPCAV